MKKASLKTLRRELREKDREIVKLLNERAKVSIVIGELKESGGWEVYDPAQESKVHDHLREMNEGPLSSSALKNIFCEIISSSRALQAPTTVWDRRRHLLTWLPNLISAKAHNTPHKERSLRSLARRKGKGSLGEWCQGKIPWKGSSRKPWPV